jgi:2-dehydropantoate 2-reductase
MDAIHVVGAGGIGCAVGYALRMADVPVVFVEARREKIEAGRRHGVRVDNRPALQAEFVHFDDWALTPGATVLLCTKCYDNAAVLAKIPAGAALIPIQNGFDPALDALGHEFEGIASFVSQCAPDVPHTRITRPGDLHIGRRGEEHTRPAPLAARRGPTPQPPPCREGVNAGVASCASASVEEATPAFTPSLQGGGWGVGPRRAALFRVKLIPHIEPIKYAKLMYNAAISPLAAAAGLDNGALLSVPEARALFFALLQENYRILCAAGITLGKVGPFHPRTVAWILRRKWLAGLMARFFEPSLRGTYCSMAGEIQKGRTEIDNYNGHLVRLAERAGVPCPLNRAALELVAHMTAECRYPHREALRELAAVTS